MSSGNDPQAPAAAQVPFVIPSMTRSGAWQLVETLNKHPRITSNGEALNLQNTWPAGDRAQRAVIQLIDLTYTRYRRRGKVLVLERRNQLATLRAPSGRP